MGNDSEFYNQAARALAGCQLVEQALKLYITEALLLAKKCIGDKMAFRMSGDDYEDTPLGPLIRVFAKLSDNAELVAALKSFTTDRNFLSHRAIASCLDPDGELDLPESAKQSSLMVRIEIDAKRLETAVRQEANKFLAYLHFEDLDAQQPAAD